MAFELQVLCNGLIRDDLEVSIQYPTRVEASKMAKGKNLDRDDLRVVRIGALDYNMCGCMHVPVSYTHLDVYKRQILQLFVSSMRIQGKNSRLL